MSYLPPPCRSNFVEDFFSSVKIHELVLMSSLMRHLQRSVEFWQRRKKWKVKFVCLYTAIVDLTYSVLKIVFEFMFSKMNQHKRNLVRSLVPRLSETLNKLLG